MPCSPLLSHICSPILSHRWSPNLHVVLPFFGCSRVGNDGLRAPSLFGAASVRRIRSPRHDVWSYFSASVSSLEHREYLLVGNGFCASRSSPPRDRSESWVERRAPLLPVPDCRASSEINSMVETRDLFCSLGERKRLFALFPRPVSPRDRLSDASRRVLGGQ